MREDQRDILKMVLMLPELACFIVVMVICGVFSVEVGDLGGQIRDAGIGFGVGFVLAAATLLATTFKVGGSILTAPDQAKDELFRGWPGFYKLRRRIKFSQILSIAGLVVTAIGVTSIHAASPFWGLSLTAASLTASGYTLASVANAKWRLADFTKNRAELPPPRRTRAKRSAAKVPVKQPAKRISVQKPKRLPMPKP